MEKSKVYTQSGDVTLTVYEREDVSPMVIRVKNVIQDIYSNLPDFNEKIYWINKVNVKEKGKTIADVLDQFTEMSGNDKFIICQAGLLNSDLPVQGDNNDALEVIQSQKGYILDAYFYNIYFNRRMAQSYTNPDICIYSNEMTEEWIKENKGEDKIINRVLASSKL